MIKIKTSFVIFIALEISFAPLAFGNQNAPSRLNFRNIIMSEMSPEYESENLPSYEIPSNSSLTSTQNLLDTEWKRLERAEKKIADQKSKIALIKASVGSAQSLQRRNRQLLERLRKVEDDLAKTSQRLVQIQNSDICLKGGGATNGE